MKPISGKKLGKILERRGWVAVRSRGSHRSYRSPDGQTHVTVPVHANKDMSRGTQKSLMKQAGLTDDDL